jgi:release factor glutamine methyltransferase
LVEEAAPGRWPTVLEQVVTARHAARLEDMVRRRVAGEPLQYVIGSWGFRGLDLYVDHRVLIPRPETEEVVQHALSELDRQTADRDPGNRGVVVDLGTGSGAIALAVAAERPGTEVWATDVSAGALAVASANLAGLGGRAATTVRLTQGSWWEALPGDLRGRVDVAVSNPPYISSGEMKTLPPEVAGWEPRQALDAGPSGLEAVHAVIGGARPWLRDGGAVVVEIAPHQAEAASAAAKQTGFSRVEVRGDLAGRPRVLVAS